MLYIFSPSNVDTICCIRRSCIDIVPFSSPTKKTFESLLANRTSHMLFVNKIREQSVPGSKDTRDNPLLVKLNKYTDFVEVATIILSKSLQKAIDCRSRNKLQLTLQSLSIKLTLKLTYAVHKIFPMKQILH